MKITIEIDCTAQEARELLGLPNVQEMQKKWLKKTEEAIMADPQNFSPEKLLESWSKGAAPDFEMMSGVFQSVLKSALSGKK